MKPVATSTEKGDSMKRFNDFAWWFQRFCDQPSRVARSVVLCRREHPREVVRAAIAALREWKAA